MAYQIPQQLEYREKIMFGLTFKQLAYALGFGIFSFIVFRKVIFPFGFVLSFILASIGIGFMFLDFDVKIKNYYFYFKSRKFSTKIGDFSKFVGFNKIQDDVIIDSRNKKIAILKVNPVNFSIKLPEEKETIMLAFQKFLNSLDFPTQIIMNTEGLELDSYLKALKERTSGKGVDKNLEEYSNFLNNTIHSKKIMNRVFYLVIPEQNDIEIQVNICIERFNALNLRVERLKDKELQILVSQFIPQESVKNTNSLINSPSHFELNKRFYRIMYASGYPRTVEAGFLDRIVSLLGDFNLSLHIKPYPIERMLIDLNKELQKQRSDLYAMQSKGIINPSLEIQYRDTRKTLESLQKGNERLFNISLYITCKADSLHELEILTRKVEAELNSIMILPKTANWRMIQGFRSSVPLGIDELNQYRNITTSALSAFFPFTSQFLQADNTGVWLGLNKNQIPIIKDIFKLSNPNGVVLAQSGGGKSYFCKLLITRYLLNGTKVIIIDPQGEYKSLVRRFNGQIIDLSRSSQTLINPLDLMGHEYIEKRLSLMDLLPIMLGDLSEPQKAFVDKALTLAYTKKGISSEEASQNREPPIMADLLESLNKLSVKATQVEKASLRSVINRVEMYVSGVFGFMNRHTNVEFNNRLVCFDLGNMPKQVKPAIMFLVLDYVYMKMKSDLDRKLLLVDEAWSLLSRAEDANYILEIVKTCRKFNLGLLLINQEVEDLFNSRAGKSVLANSAYTMLLKQKPSVISKITETFHLSPSEREHLLTASVGEGLLIMEDEHSKIRVIASPEEHATITTNADEILNKKLSDKINEPLVSLNIDTSKLVHKRANLKKEEIEFLLKRGYLESTKRSICSNKNEKYLIKIRPKESINHLFFVHDVASFFESKGFKVETYATRLPDVIISKNNKRYAFEVETGTLAKHKERLLEKVKFVKSQDYTDWFFIVTDRNLVNTYKKFGKTIDPRYLRKRLSALAKEIN